MSNYKANKARAVYIETMETLTDQSQASDTDINVIMRKATQGQMVHGHAAGPQYGDFAELPSDLKTAIETARGIRHIRNKLPAALKEKPIEELLALSREELKAIVDPAPIPAPEVPTT